MSRSSPRAGKTLGVELSLPGFGEGKSCKRLQQSARYREVGVSVSGCRCGWQRRAPLSVVGRPNMRLVETKTPEQQSGAGGVKVERASSTERGSGRFGDRDHS